MKTSYILALGIVTLVAALLAIGTWFGPTPSEQDDGFVDTNSATATPEAVGDTPDGGSEDAGTEVENNTEEKDSGTRTPQATISLTPYSVYLGFATSVGTSSESLMKQEGPLVVVGYEWEALPGSVMFSSLDLPAWDDSPEGKSRPYMVSVWNKERGVYEPLGEYTVLDELDFPRKGFVGVRRFKVTGIDPDLRICPGDRSFIWDARFTFEGSLGLIRTPITELLPAGETCRLR